MKKIFGLLALAGLFQVAAGQDCKLYFPETENAQIEYKNFDKKNKVTGSSVQQIKDIKRSAGSVSAVIEAETFDNKGTSQGKATFDARCENGMYYVDMSKFINQESIAGFKDMEMTIEGGSLEMPSSLNAGDALKPAEMKMVFSSGGTTVMTMTISITNRKVEGIQDVTTDAGTFTCHKISYDIATKMMFNIKAKVVEYYNEEVGMVKSESYTSSGDFQGYTVLSAIKK